MKNLAFCLILACSIQQMVRAGDIYACPHLFDFWNTQEISSGSGTLYSILELVGYIEDIESCPLYIDPILGNVLPIAAGSFTQGSPLDEPCREVYLPGSETQFEHTLTRDILVMETEVSRQMWEDLKAVQPSLPPDPSYIRHEGMDKPVQYNSFGEALLFANLLSIERGFAPCYYKDATFTVVLNDTNYTSGNYYCDFDASGYRLPTEGEWEYFTRAGTTGPLSIDVSYPIEDCAEASSSGMFPNLELLAWFFANRNDPLGYDHTKPVGLKNPNWWGLKDVYGNVWERCWDVYAIYPSGAVIDYTNDSVSGRRVARGGSYIRDLKHCRSAMRVRYYDSTSQPDLGFRLVRTDL